MKPVRQKFFQRMNLLKALKALKASMPLMPLKAPRAPRTPRALKALKARNATIAATTALVLAAGMLLGSCDRTQEEQNQEQLLFASLLYLYQEEGSCVRSVQLDENTAQVQCYNAPRILCAHGRIYDPSGFAYVTEETYARYNSQWEAIEEDHPECDTAILYAMIDPGMQPTSESKVDAVKEDNHYQVLERCQSTENPRSDDLLSEQQYSQLRSARGFLTMKARQYEQGECLDSLAPENDFLELVDRYLDGTHPLRTICTYNTQGAGTCNESEYELAHPFFK